MGQPTLSRVVHTLRNAARLQADPAASDRDLLDRFLRDRDDDAFRALVARHGKTVLAACRQVLSDPASIDDTFQATFLVLLRKAKTVDASTPLGGWLFAVAHRVAVRCRSDARRRRSREAEAAKRTRQTTELSDLSWREAAAVLHDELNALPDKYRLPLLLCCVQGLTRDEAAQQLGTTVGAVRGQLERGRTLLEKRLTKRGIVFSAGLLAVLMKSSRAAGGPSAVLIDLTLRAAGGGASAAVAALAHGALPMTALLKHAVLPAVLVLGLIGVGVGVGKWSSPVAAEAQKPATEKLGKRAVKAGNWTDGMKSDVKERTITGRVLGPDGQPTQAELSLVWMEGRRQALGRTNIDGTFKVTVPPKFKVTGGWLVARAAGHGVDFQPRGMDDLPQSMTIPAEVTLKLPKERPIRGRIIDQQGKPVSGATVVATRIVAFDSDASADSHLKKATEPLFNFGAPPGGDRSMWFSDQRGDNSEGRSPYTATTDSDGRFEITGVGAGQLVTLRVRGKGIADDDVLTLNRDGFDPTPINKAARDNEMKRFVFRNTSRWHMYGPDPVVVVEPEKIIRGAVTDHTGKPRVGVRVVFSRSSKDDFIPDPKWAVTDKDGRYEIHGARRYKRYMVECPPDAEAGLLPCQGFADDTIGYEPITIDLKCAKGLVVTGTVKNKATGEPVSAKLDVEVLVNNPFVKNYPPFLHSAARASYRFQTDKDGRFRMVTIPGPVLLMALPAQGGWGQFKPATADPKYPDYFSVNEHGAPMFHKYSDDSAVRGFVRGVWCRVIDPKPTDTVVTRDIELEPATNRTVRVVDADGKSLTGTRATGITHREFDDPSVFPDRDVLTVYYLEPDRPRLLAVVHESRMLVGTATIRADDRNPVVRLGPGGSVTGRVVDTGGKPLAGARVLLGYNKPAADKLHAAIATGTGVVTDANGAFHIDMVFPGVKFGFGFRRGNTRYTQTGTIELRVIEEHGESLDLGDIKVTKAERRPDGDE